MHLSYNCPTIGPFIVNPHPHQLRHLHHHPYHLIIFIILCFFKIVWPTFTFWFIIYLTNKPASTSFLPYFISYLFFLSSSSFFSSSYLFYLFSSFSPSSLPSLSKKTYSTPFFCCVFFHCFFSRFAFYLPSFLTVNRFYINKHLFHIKGVYYNHHHHHHPYFPIV